jgi:hypothetical protein
MANDRAGIMPHTLIQNIITKYPNFSDPTASAALSAVTDRCVERICSCKEPMSQDEMDALCYVLCSVSNYEEFDKLAKIIVKRAEIGITPEVYTLFVDRNQGLIAPETNRRMYLYGLHPNTPNLVNLVMGLSRLDVPVNEQIAHDVATAMVPGLEITEEEEAIFDFLDEQLWNKPVESIDELVVICEQSGLLEQFLDKKRNYGNQKTDYILHIFNNLLEGEKNFPFEKHKEYTKHLVTFMGILVKAIDPLSFQSQETILTEGFIASKALSPLVWLETVVTSPKLKQTLQENISKICKDMGMEASDFSGEVSASNLDSAVTLAGLFLDYSKLPQRVEILQKLGFPLEDVMAMEPDVMDAILLSLSANVEEQPNEYVEKPKPEFGLPFITRQWHDARFIDEYLLNFRDALADKECGLMPSITDLETLDYEYISKVVRGETGILRVKNINEEAEENQEFFSEDPKRKFQQLLWPTCTGQSHFGLLMLNFNEEGRLEGGFYFEPKKDFGRQNLSTILKTMENKYIIQLNMGQMDDDFCGDYVITVISWFTQFLNPRIVEWSTFEEISQAVLDKVSNDRYYAQLISGEIHIDGVERLRCDMALHLGQKFIDYLNPSIEISLAQWENEVLPAITKRHAELSVLDHVKNTFKQSEKGSSATIKKQPTMHEDQAASPFTKSVPSPCAVNSSDSFFKTVPDAFLRFNPESDSQGGPQQSAEPTEAEDDEDIGKLNRI